MAKINHTNYLDVIDSVWSAAKEKGIMHINSQENSFDGTKFKIKGKELINFGTCGYLGLEKHPKMIEGAIDLIKKFGTQLSMSRAYIRPTYIQELEELMSEIFNGNKVICYTSTSNAHISVVANLIKSDDLIILDQQVHFSVQFPCKNTRLSGTTVKMVKHSDWDALEEMIKSEYNNFNRIWYMADGVYSMHGDLPDTERLKLLLNKYPKLHLYFDDAHGMGWSGSKGAGYIFDRLGVSKRIVIISTLAKGFGCVGGTAIFADPEMYRKIDIFGGPLSYSHPLSPANVGAAIASAKIHLSPEINQYQNELSALMTHMDNQLKEKNLPNLSAPHSPIYFIASGLNKVTRNFVHRILNEGLYVNTAIFPVVASDKAGLRFTLTRHNTKSDIDTLVDAMAYHLPKAIEEEGDSIERVYTDFGFKYTGKINENKVKENKTLTIEEYSSIKEIDKETWDNALKDRGNFSHEALQCIEEIFSDNEKPEENWSFHYLIIKDKAGKTVLATFFTGALYKDDMLTQENISKKIEQIRKKNPYYLCSKTLAMGCLFAEGQFLYLDEEHPETKNAMSKMFTFVQKKKKEINASTIIFRDFEDNSPLNSVFEEEGYVKLKMPNSNRVQNKKWNNYEELFALIPSANNKKNIKRYVLKNEQLFEVQIKKQISDEEADHYFQLFSNVKDKNFGFNFFKYPKKLIKTIAKHPNWEFIDIKIKGQDKAIACVWSYVGEDQYCPLIIGLDYDYSESHHIYQQGMFQVIKRGNALNKKTVYLGFSADFEKQKYNAVGIPTNAFIKIDDTYNMELIESFSNTTENITI